MKKVLVAVLSTLMLLIAPMAAMADTSLFGQLFSGSPLASAIQQAQGTAQADTVNYSPGTTIPAVATGETAVFTIGSKTVTVNGQPYQMDVAPYIDSAGRTQVPVRYLADVLGATNVAWNPVGQAVTLSFAGSVPTVTMQVGNHNIFYAGGGLYMDTVPVIVPPGRTMLPARYVAQAERYQVSWDAANQTVTITTPKPIPAGTIDGFAIPQGTLLRVTGDPPSLNTNPQGINMVVNGDKGSIASQLADVKTILMQAPYLDPTTVNNVMTMLDQNAKGGHPQYQGVFNSPNGGGVVAGSAFLADGNLWMSVQAAPQTMSPLPSSDEGIWPQSYKG